MADVGPQTTEIALQLERWIDPAAWGWYSGDTHLHQMGYRQLALTSDCVTPQTLIRHVRG